MNRFSFLIHLAAKRVMKRRVIKAATQCILCFLVLGSKAIANSGPNDYGSSKIRISANPSEAELRSLSISEYLLVPSRVPSAAENQALGTAIQEFSRRTTIDDASALTTYLDESPGSPWRISVLTELGCFYYRFGYFSKALNVWESAWQEGKTEAPGEITNVVDIAVGEFARLNAKLGRMDDLARLFSEMQNRKLGGPATEMLTGAHEGLALMRRHPETSFRCGPLALGAALAMEQPANAQKGHVRADPRVDQLQSTKNGTSLDQLAEYAAGLKCGYQPAKRSGGAGIIVPSVVHWKVGHFAAILRKDGGGYIIQDPTFGGNLWMTEAAVDAESSGYFLIPAGELKPGWHKAASEECRGVWGRGNTTQNNPKDCDECQDKIAGDDYSGCGGGCYAMPRYTVHSMLVSLHIRDTPIWYNTPSGLIEFTLTYNQRDEFLRDNEQVSLGPKWNIICMSYVDEVSGTNSHPLSVSIYEQGGGIKDFSFPPYDTYGGQIPDRVWSDGRNFKDQSRLSYTAAGFERQFTDGSKCVYDYPSTRADGHRRFYLTSFSDQKGRTVQYNYALSDGTTGRPVIRTVVEGYHSSGNLIATGTTQFAYGSGLDSKRLESITIPDGRSATFHYAGVHLQSITDMGGITSSFQYEGDFIKALTTPYGTSRFAYGDATTETEPEESDRWIELTDPLGGKERVEFAELPFTSQDVPYSDPSSIVPQGIFARNWILTARNTFYWSKKAMAEAPRDYTKAKIKHWLHSADYGSAIGVLESEKQPLENRVWYNYPGQDSNEAATLPGTLDLPCKVARVLDDGSTQMFEYSYDDFGNVATVKDPLNRVTKYEYMYQGDPENPDALLQYVKQQVVGTSGTTWEILTAYDYSNQTWAAQHLPTAVTDAAGQTTSFTYTDDGQVASTTRFRNGLLETGSNKYGDTVGASDYKRLKEVYGPGSVLLQSFTYDSKGRRQTSTDALGDTTTYEYDTLDRLTKVTYPDATYEQTTYNRLDPEWKRDRLGRWSFLRHNALRKEVLSEDPEGRQVQYEWCPCGALEAIIDGEGHRTTFFYDVQSRLTTKVYADSKSLRYKYEATTSRLKYTTDAKNQRTNYTYYRDNQVQSVSYTDTSENPLTPPTPGVSYEYDPNYPRITKMMDVTGTTEYGYHPVVSGTLGAGKLAYEEGPLPGTVDRIEHTYDEFGRELSCAIDGVSWAKTYDALGRAATETNPLGGFTYGYVGNTGLIKSGTYPNGQVTDYGYYDAQSGANGVGNGARRLKQILNKTSDGSTISEFTYKYNEGGDIVEWGQTSGTKSISYGFGYDGASQLTAATVIGTGTTQYSYQYDKAGNRLLEQIGAAVSSGTYNELNQLKGLSGSGRLLIGGTLSESGTVTVAGQTVLTDGSNRFKVTIDAVPGPTSIPISAVDVSGSQTNKTLNLTVESGVGNHTLLYDDNGNMTDDGAGRTFSWDAANRLVGVTKSGTIYGFVYNQAGQRVCESVNGTVVRRWIWCGMELREELSPDLAVCKRYCSKGVTIGQTIPAPESDKFYYTRDHLGSVREVTAHSGAVRARYGYDPYGRMTKMEGDIEADFGYTGHYFHALSGLVFAFYRGYDAVSARWLNRDPLGEEGGLNLYRYVGCNPISRLDPLGLEMVDTGLVIYEKFWGDTTHAWIGLDGRTAGRCPNGGIFCAPSNVNSPDIHDGEEDASAYQVKLDDCFYDIGKFRSCVASKMVDGADAGTYCVLWSNCITWINDLVAECRRAAWKKGSKCKCAKK